MTVSEHIDALRKLMKERGYDIYIVPTDDFHQSENVGAYFQARTFITPDFGQTDVISYRPSNSFQALRLLSIACWNQVSRVSTSSWKNIYRNMVQSVLTDVSSL